MKLVQINSKIERHFRGIVMTPFLSSMHSSYYIYLLYVNLQPTIFDSKFSLGILNLKIKSWRTRNVWVVNQAVKLGRRDIDQIIMDFYGQTWSGGP